MTCLAPTSWQPTGPAVWIVAAVLAVQALVLLPSATAQMPGDAAAERWTTATTNLFASFESSDGIDGYVIDLPRGWLLQDVTVLRYGSERVDVEVDRQAQPVRVRTANRLQGPHDVVLQVQTGRREGEAQWSIAPCRLDSSRTLQPRTSRRKQERVRLAPPPPADAANPAIEFTPDAAAPVVVSDGGLPVLNSRSPFTVEFWMQTTDLSAVLLSTWTGEESQPYPLEVVVDASGRLRAYTGEPNRHQALLTDAPVADGQWHHVAVAHDPDARTLRLLLDGRPADSLTGVRVASPLRPSRIALGGRLQARDQEPKARFTGRLDEIRVWRLTRSVDQIRAAMRRPSSDVSVPAPTADRSSSTADSDAPPAFVHLDAATDDGALVIESRDRLLPRGVTPTASTLRFVNPLQGLRAETGGEGVRLRWQGPTDDVEAFVVERSSDGQAFTRAGRLGPADAASTGKRGRGQYTYTDPAASGPVVYYRIRQVHSDGSERLSGTVKVGLGDESQRRTDVRLLGNFPNPFSATTTVTFEVTDEATPVTLTVWDVTGQRVAQLADGRYSPGTYELSFAAGSRPSGTYFLRLDAPGGTQSHRMVLLR